MRRLLPRAGACAAIAGVVGCGGGGGSLGFAPSKALFSAARSLSLGAGHGPAAVVTADLDGDGRMDAAVANDEDGSVDVLLGAGDGTFRGVAEYPLGVGTEAVAVAAGDFDRDGRLDLAVADRAGNRVVLLKGSIAGTFSFWGEVDLPAGALPSAVVAADLDGDGKLDVATCNRGLATVSAALGRGDGTFAPPVSRGLGSGFSPRAMVAADFDRDGRLDLAVASGAQGSVAWLAGHGDGTFSSPVATGVAAGASLAAVAAADVDRDGALDLVVANETAGRVAIVLGHGDGTFSAPLEFVAGPDPAGIFVGDFDRDGRVDVAAALRGTGQVAVLLGNGDGTLRGAVRLAAAGSGSDAVAAADLDGNGSLDLVVANGTGDGVSTLLGVSHAIPLAFSPAATVPIGDAFEPTSVVVADLNRDGRPDLVVANRAHSSVSVALGTGSGSFAAPVEFSTGAGSSPVMVVAADLNRDGALDLVVADAAGDAVAVLLGTGSGTFALPTAFPVAAGSHPSALVVGDFDRDGRPDLAVACGSLPHVSIALGRGDGTFAAAPDVALPSGFRASAVATGDFNRDGRLDLALAGATTGNVALVLGDGAGSFGTVSVLVVDGGADLSGLAVVDLDADGRLDLAVANASSGRVAVLRGAGNGTFSGPASFAAGFGVSCVVAGEFERNGRLGLAVTFAPSGDIAVLRGNGDGTFAAAVDFPTAASGAVSLATGDLDGDARLDVVTANRTSGSVGALTRP